MDIFSGIVGSFLVALPALFSIVNPIGGALIFAQVAGERTPEQRRDLAERIGVYAAFVMIGALWIGVYVLNFFGVTLDALRIAGGLVVAVNGWQLLSAPERHEDRKMSQADEAREAPPDVAFFPLTMPLTTGPGTISVAIALGANRPTADAAFLAYAAGVTLAAVALAAMIFVCYRSADRIVSLLGGARAQVVQRLSAFLLLCIGAQITISGVTDALRHAGFAPH